MDVQELKRQAAAFAVQFVQPGMIVGLGHGSTALFAVRRIAELMRSGALHTILGVPCSKEIEAQARALSIPLTTLDEHPQLDITIDGADEVDPHLNLIKGGGGALLREKIVAQATRREIIIVDESKLSPQLGTRWAVPVEVLPFGFGAHQRFLTSLGAEARLRRSNDDAPFVTDQGNWILDCRFGAIADTYELAAQLNQRAGIVEHGLFLDIAADVIVAGASGVRHLQRARTSE